MYNHYGQLKQDNGGNDPSFAPGDFTLLFSFLQLDAFHCPQIVPSNAFFIFISISRFKSQIFRDGLHFEDLLDVFFRSFR